MFIQIILFIAVTISLGLDLLHSQHGDPHSQLCIKQKIREKRRELNFQLVMQMTVGLVNTSTKACGKKILTTSTD